MSKRRQSPEGITAGRAIAGWYGRGGYLASEPASVLGQPEDSFGAGVIVPDRPASDTHPTGESDERGEPAMLQEAAT